MLKETETEETIVFFIIGSISIRGGPNPDPPLATPMLACYPGATATAPNVNFLIVK